MTRLLLALALTLLTTTTAHAQLTRDSVGAGRGALDGQLTWGASYRPGFGRNSTTSVRALASTRRPLR